MIRKLGAGTVSLCEKTQDSGATLKHFQFFFVFWRQKVALPGVFSIFGVFFDEKKYRFQNVKHVWASTYIKQHVCGAV